MKWFNKTYKHEDQNLAILFDILDNDEKNVLFLKMRMRIVTLIFIATTVPMVPVVFLLAVLVNFWFALAALCFTLFTQFSLVNYFENCDIEYARQNADPERITEHDSFMKRFSK